MLKRKKESLHKLVKKMYNKDSFKQGGKIMLQNNPDFTVTVGTVKEQIAQTQGMGDVKVYDENQKSSLTNDRPADQVQKDIYQVPDRKLMFQDLAGALGGNRDGGED